MSTQNGLHLNNLKPVKINYQAGRVIVSLNNPSIDIVDGKTMFTGTNDYGVRMTLQTDNNSLFLVGKSVAVSQAYSFRTRHMNDRVLLETYRVTDINNTDHFISIFYEQPSEQSTEQPFTKNYEKIESIPSNQTRFFDLDDEIVDAFAESLENNRKAMSSYNSFINKNRNRPNVSNEIKNEMPKDTQRQYEHLKEFFKNNKEEIRRILDL